MNEKLIKNFRNKIISGKPVFGPFMKTCDPGFVEVAGYAGMDFAILDMEPLHRKRKRLCVWQNLLRTESGVYVAL